MKILLSLFVQFSVAATRIPMINLEDGSVLGDEECPKKGDLEEWMQQHPGYMIDNSICLLDPYLSEVQASISTGSVAKGFSAAGSSRSGNASSNSSSLPKMPTPSMPSKGDEDDASQVVLNTPEIGPVGCLIFFIFLVKLFFFGTVMVAFHKEGRKLLSFILYTV